MDNKTHYVGPGCLQYVAFFSSWTMKELQKMSEDELHVEGMRTDEQIADNARKYDVNMVVAWGITPEGRVPFPVAEKIGESDEWPYVALTIDDVRSLIEREMKNDRDIAREEMRRRAEARGW